MSKNNDNNSNNDNGNTRHLKQSCRELPARTDYDLKTEGLSLDEVGESTGLVASRCAFSGTPSTPLVTPVYHTSTYVLDKPEDLLNCARDGGSVYSRAGNHTTEALEATINVIERGAGSLTFASGMAAISTVLFSYLGKGDHVILQVPCYGGSVTVIKHMVESFGLELTTVKHAAFDDVVKATKTNTKMIWIETPSNPEVLVVDVRQMTRYAKVKDILVAVDGSMAGPYAQKVIDLGADFSVQSCSKYMGGHCDLLAGCVTTKTIEQWRALLHMRNYLGNMLSPHDASLLHRSLKTLPLRMERISHTATKVAAFLDGHPKVERVHFPGLQSHPQHQVALQQMRVPCGMIMADVRGGGDGGRTVVTNTKIFKLAVSFGGAHSVIEHPYGMTHCVELTGGVNFRDETGVTPGMLRISIGLEDPEDLIADLDQALAEVVLQ